ncbi:GMC family oxidoreductase [Allorhodopirellula solitaria]|uniref:Alcohol dehydrogenase [acceptor] n=1 Tax=Allorhodopirellula solitaria TaxID=2527987 RepID=A0A5C5YJ64_9BACT|nr:GMC family oxidoreductase [Allorhodopirellula solitaria]TWT74914.1 Alcohol dehydrogenase [acceptor] [Allorhodopirellula solitaria]
MHDKIDATALADAPDHFDGDVILGGGVCGCLLAHELLQRGDRPVWIIEAGGRQDENAIDRSQPARWLHLLGSTDDDSHITMPNSGLAGRAITWPRGRGLGGSGRINAMIWVPPHADDFQSLTLAGLQPDRLENAWQRASELIAVESPRYLSPPSQQVLAALRDRRDLGEFSAYRRINRNGRRWTTEQLLIDALQNHFEHAARLNCVRAAAASVAVERERVRSVTLHDGRDRRTVRLGDDARLISCLGALASPALLMRSGIGSPELLAEAGVAPRIASMQVGRNLHDHLIMPVIYDRESPAFLPGAPQAGEVEQWEREGTGPLASNIAECGGFDPDAKFQLHVTPTDYLRYPQGTAASAVTLGVQLTRPLSRGWIAPHRDAPDAPMDLHSNYMSDPADVASLPDGVRWARQIAQAGGWDAERVPGKRRLDDARILAAIARYAQTLYHPGGTCALGHEISHAVTSPEFQVHGVDGLSIVDASLLPCPTVGNPTAVLATIACYAGERLSTSNIDSRIRA